MPDILDNLFNEIHAELSKILEHEDPMVRDVATTVRAKADEVLAEARTAIETAGKQAVAAAAPVVTAAADTIEGIMASENVSAGEAAGILQRRTPAA